MILNIVNKIYLFLFLFYSGIIISQEKRIEEIYQECAYNTLSDKGKALKCYTKSFEKYLIEVQILKDSTPTSYYKLFKSLSEGKTYDTDNFKYSYSDSINKNKEERLKIFPISSKCVKELSKFKSSQKIIEEKLYASINNGISIKELLKRAMAVIKIKDFELDYYKHRTFALLYLLDDI